VQKYANCLLTPSGDVSCLATIPSDVEAEATFIAKADGVIAGISLADMIFNQVDPSLKVSTLHLFSHFRFWRAMILLVVQGVLTVLTLLISRLNGLKVMEIMSIKDCNLAKYMVKMVNNIVCFRLQQLAS
jgi:nicotinate-nucleotide pyrophosphorylase